MTMTTSRHDADTAELGDGSRGRRSTIWMIVGGVALLALVVGGLVILFSDDSTSEVDREAEVLEELVADIEAELEVYYGESDPSRYVAKYAEDITYFDPWVDGKLEGRVAASDHLMAFTGTIPPFAYEVVNADVELEGDTAIFSYEIDLSGPDGEDVLTWNVTEIFRDAQGDRELIHAHFGVAGAAPEAEG